jgi:hypothetical protein
MRGLTMTERNANTGEVVRGERLVFSTREDRFAAFDKLPKKVRQALAAGEIDWETSTIVRMKRKHKLGQNDLVQFIRERNYQVWAKSYPGIEEAVYGTASV